MQRCPVCRAGYTEGTSCKRCRADLSALLRIEREAECLARQAAGLWASGETKAAADAAQKSLALKGTELAQVILLLVQNDQYTRVGDVGVSAMENLHGDPFR